MNEDRWAHRIAVVKDMEPVVEALLPQLRPVADCWQPSDLLPSLRGEGWQERLQDLRTEAARLPDELLVVLVGNVVTEEALPSYLAALNRFGGQADRTGTDSHPWARWSRGWTAEEKRHGDVTRGYLLLSGRVDLHSVEVTVQNLLRNGFDTRADGDPYRGLAYASFQEHATKTAWSQLGRLCGNEGAPLLHRICGLVAADEARHERVYAALLKETLQRDPSGALEALEATLTHAIVMPARRMDDGVAGRLFERFADVGQRIGIYGLRDYAENLRQLLDLLGVEALTGLDEAGERARETLCALPPRFEMLAREREARPARPTSFAWIDGRRA